MVCRFLGLIIDVRNVLHVMTACSVIVFHIWKGHSTSVEHRPLIKWVLNVWIARSAALVGSTNCQSQFSVLRKAFMGFVAWLSVTLKEGLWGLYLTTADNALIGLVLLARAMWHALCCTLDCCLSVAPVIVSWGGGQNVYTHLGTTVGSLPNGYIRSVPLPRIQVPRRRTDDNPAYSRVRAT